MRRNQHEREVSAIDDNFRRAMDSDFREICPTLAGAMQENHQRPFLLFVLVVSLRRKKQIPQRHFLRVREIGGFGFLIAGHILGLRGGIENK